MDILNFYYKMQVHRPDIVIPLGSACKTAENLNLNKLRKFSFPLDWMMKYSLDSALELFKADFRNFFNKKREDTEQKFHHRYIIDENNGMVAMHHFPHGEDIDLYYNSTFLPTMLRRYNHVKNLMLESTNILYVTARVNEDFISFLKEMHKLFPVKSTLLNICDSKEEKFYYKKINNELKFIQYSFHDNFDKSVPDFWKGDIAKWKEVLSKVKLMNRNWNSSDIDKL